VVHIQAWIRNIQSKLSLSNVKFQKKNYFEFKILRLINIRNPLLPILFIGLFWFWKNLRLLLKNLSRKSFCWKKSKWFLTQRIFLSKKRLWLTEKWLWAGKNRIFPSSEIVRKSSVIFPNWSGEIFSLILESKNIFLWRISFRIWDSKNKTGPFDGPAKIYWPFELEATSSTASIQVPQNIKSLKIELETKRFLLGKMRNREVERASI